MKIASFSEMLQKLAGLDTWLISLGITPKNDRWHEAAKVVQRAKEQRELIDRGGERKFIANYIPGLFDATEIHEIMRAFSGCTSAAIKEKILRASSGPIAPLEEQPKNSVARNTMFELSLAADWKNGGAVVELGEPDIRVQFDDTVYLVECKRPFYDHSVLANIKDAAGKLGEELDKGPNRKAFGIIAISVSRVFDRGDRICRAPANEGRRAIREALEELIEEHREQWQRKALRDFHERIVAVLFQLAVPWDIEGERLINASAVNLVQIGKIAEGWKILEKNMAPLYAA